MRNLTFALLLGAMFACNNPERAQQNADKAQAQADDDKVKAQAEADRKQATANEVLTKAKNGYRSTFTDLLADLDKHAADLSASKLTAKASDVASIDKKLGVIAGLRATIVADMKMLDTATAENWDSLKDQFDKDTMACRSSLVFGKV